MSDHSSKMNKLGVIVFLWKSEQPDPEEVRTDFLKRWPTSPILWEAGQECYIFTLADGGSARIELHSERVLPSLTDYLVSGTRHWPEAQSELASHHAHLTVAVPLRGYVEVELARSLTKLLISILSLIDSIGVCWLNAPVLNSAKDFIGIGTEMLGVGLLPLPLWVGAYWRPDEHAIVSSGMAQFELPEIQMEYHDLPSVGAIEYFYELANYVAAKHEQILDGETIDGPQGTLGMHFGPGIVHGRRSLILQKVVAQ
jgi:hypothetical protein